MKNTKRKTVVIISLALALLCMVLAAFPAFAAGEGTREEAAEPEEAQTDSVKSSKALAAGIAVGIAAAAGAIGMAIAVAKSTEGMARQPEATGKINSAMMLGLVFIETALIYALIVAILIIFVL